MVANYEQNDKQGGVKPCAGRSGGAPVPIQLNRRAIHMSESALKTIIRGALRAAGFRGYRASVYYSGGMARVRLNNGCEGVYSVHKGGFISWN